MIKVDRQGEYQAVSILLYPEEARRPKIPLYLAASRLLILSPFSPTQRRVTADLAARRNELVAVLADEAWFAHITPGGQSDRLTKLLADWQIPFSARASDHQSGC